MIEIKFRILNKKFGDNIPKFILEKLVPVKIKKYSWNKQQKKKKKNCKDKKARPQRSKNLAISCFLIQNANIFYILT